MKRLTLEIIPEGWSQLQCAKCKMVFALPPDGSPLAHEKILRKELDRYVEHNHPREDVNQAATRIIREAPEKR
jgi:hypothetical protein